VLIADAQALRKAAQLAKRGGTAVHAYRLLAHMKQGLGDHLGAVRHRWHRKAAARLRRLPCRPMLRPLPLRRCSPVSAAGSPFYQSPSPPHLLITHPRFYTRTQSENDQGN
jgi:hypothetical protein